MKQTQSAVRTLIQQAIEDYVKFAGERKIRWMESQVIQIKDGRVILYGANLFEGPIVEYQGSLGTWQSAMTSTLKLRGDLRKQK